MIQKLDPIQARLSEMEEVHKSTEHPQSLASRLSNAFYFWSRRNYHTIEQVPQKSMVAPESWNEERTQYLEDNIYYNSILKKLNKAKETIIEKYPLPIKEEPGVDLKSRVLRGEMYRILSQFKEEPNFIKIEKDSSPNNILAMYLEEKEERAKYSQLLKENKKGPMVIPGTNMEPEFELDSITKIGLPIFEGDKNIPKKIPKKPFKEEEYKLSF
ncbi:MAG: hypothetical protein PHD81_03635 [Candidatus Nanoarchaeia archaeon]|nr:hypothetical protein [Candidatus Nanoarchaeia archaeon]MDD5588175.1 hypothetical protein [Candidatus Nanoarchaeia archaeon]